jgi:penicillin-binding protein 1A
VIKHGTGRAVRVLERPAAGKTGTTNDFNDAWFIGYTPELVTGVWVGRDDHDPLGDGETGGKVAAPIWLEFMKQAMKDRPVTDFPIPPGVRFVRLDGKGGQTPAAMSFADDAVLFEVFVDGSQPTTGLSAAPRRKKPQPGTPAPTDQPPDDLRRDLDRLDRQQSAEAPAR